MKAHAVFARSSPQPASPTARFMPKQAVEQIENWGVNFGRRSPNLGGHFSTPDHTKAFPLPREPNTCDCPFVSLIDRAFLIVGLYRRCFQPTTCTTCHAVLDWGVFTVSLLWCFLW